jgi:hypothetical protein
VSPGRPRAILRLLLTGALGVGVALLVSACGASDKLIPTANAVPLQGDFESVAQAAESGGGDCSTTEAALLKTEQDFTSLPATIDAGLHARLREGIAKLREDALARCAKPLAAGAPTTSKASTTKSTPAKTPTTTTTTETTTTATTQTPPTTSTPASTSPGGGTQAPEEGATGSGQPGAGEQGPGAQGSPGQGQPGQGAGGQGGGTGVGEGAAGEHGAPAGGGAGQSLRRGRGAGSRHGRRGILYGRSRGAR